MGVLRDLLGSRTLLVSCLADDKLFQLTGSAWSSIELKAPRGIAVNRSNGLVSVATRIGIMTFDSTGRMGQALLLDGSDEVHGATYSTSGLVMVSGSSSALITVTVAGPAVAWQMPQVTPGKDHRCYFNGIAVNAANQPHYITSLGVSNVVDGWRAQAKIHRGALIDLRAGAMRLRNLFMPHSPVVVGTTVWFLNSGTSQLCKWNPGDVDYTVVGTYAGFSRGMCWLDATHVAIGVSQGRITAFPGITTDLTAAPGVAVIDTTTGMQVDFEALDVQEVFDVEIALLPLRLS